MTMAYNCYLGGILWPVTPGKLTIKVKGKNKTLELLNEGEINFLRAPGLTEITLTLTIPMLTGTRKPEYYLKTLEKLKTKKQATQFIMTRSAPNGKLLFDTNIKVSVEDYTIDENATNGLDLSVEVSLKQYREYSTKIAKITAKKSTPQQNNTQKKENADTKTTTKEKTATVTTTKERPATTAPKTITYTVKKGDTLWGISKKYLGDGARYNEIYNANKGTIKNPNIIYAGQVLVIPQ